MPRPFEVTIDYLTDHLDEIVDATFADLQSQFLVLPRGSNFVEYAAFQDAYEVLKRHTAAFHNVTDGTVWAALVEDSLVFTVLRTIMGVTPTELAELTRAERGVRVSQGAARTLDRRCRVDRGYFSRLSRPRNERALERAAALVFVAVQYVMTERRGTK